MAAKAKAVAKAKAKPTELNVASAFVGFDDKPRTPLWCQENGSIPEAAVCGLAGKWHSAWSACWQSTFLFWIALLVRRSDVGTSRWLCVFCAKFEQNY